MKRIFALFLCLMMVLSLIPAAAAENIEIVEAEELSMLTGEDPIAVIYPETATELESVVPNHSVVMTATEFIGYLQYVVDRGDSKYGSGDQYSIGKYDGNYIYFDCWGLGESIICSKGTIVTNRNTSLNPWNTWDTSCGCGSKSGDWLEEQCQLSSNFSNMVPGEWLFREDSSGNCYHVGYYIGNGKVIESTSDGSYNTQVSTIDSSGHSNLRGSTWTWTFHGKVPWINYLEETHIHDKGTYLWFEEAHPHYKCYKCSICGEVWRDTTDSTYRTTCDQCRPGKPAFTGLEGTHSANQPVTFIWDETANTTHYNIWVYKKNSAGEYETVDHTYYVTSGYQLTLGAGQYMACLQAYDSDHFESDNSDWVHTESESTYFSVAEAVAKPTITTQPTSKTVAAGEIAKFTVKASGATGYQWQYRTSSSGTWANSTASTAKKATFSVTAESYRNGYQYRCKVTNAAGSVYSNAATLSIISKPTITTQPKSVSTTVGKTAKFTVAASGATSYQWQYRTSATGEWYTSTASTAKTATLSVTAESYRSGYQYRCKVTNSAGSVYSSAATLTVTSAAKPTITTQPKSVSTTVGKTAKFTVAASGATSYQWQYRTSATGEWYNSTTTGAKTAALSVTAESYRNGYQYRCKVTNAAGSVYSNAVTLTVTSAAKPTITTQPISKEAYEGDTVRFTVKATGATGYQWFYRTSSSGSWNKCSGTGYNTATLSVDAYAYRNGYQYRCKVTNAAGEVYTNAVTLTVK